MHLVFFEDDRFANFLPLTYTRPVYELRCGIDQLYKKIGRIFPTAKLLFCTRDYLVQDYSRRVGGPVNEIEAMDDDCLFVNGCILPSDALKSAIDSCIGTNILTLQNGRLAFAYLKGAFCREVGKEFLTPLNGQALQKLTGRIEHRETTGLTLLEYPWELVGHNAELIREEFNLVAKGKPDGAIDERVAIYGDPKNLYVAKDSFVEAGVVVDVRKGPIYIGEKSYVQTISRLEGPSYLGRDNQIFGAQVREGCSFGDVCRIGGEVEETIIQGYSNKRHVGFLGHAYLGEWINCGAGTGNSDLKNTYGTVRVTVGGKKVGAGQYVGCFVGDHAKTSIGAYIFTGKKVGVGSQAIAYVADDVPSYTLWAKCLGSDPMEIFLDSALETARRVMARRKVEPTEDYLDVLKRAYALTEEERREAGVKKGKLSL
jgi:UDP-N-acetylglucosamine diphosphorylase/glucosamine-1-phosphate N-acetyltransferase